MSIQYREDKKQFHLQAGDSSYIVRVLESGHVSHVYWGKKIGLSRAPEPAPFIDRPFSPLVRDGDAQLPLSLDTLPQEYASYGTGDYRHPSFEAELVNGSRIVDLRYAGHRILAGKPALEGLPATYVEDEVEAATLELTLRDGPTGLAVTLAYTAFEASSAIARSVRFANEGCEPIRLNRALSMSVDLPEAGFELLHLSGTWARERYVERAPLTPGIKVVGSARGASSHQHNPFLALLAPGSDEDKGDVYGFSLVYSGNFAAHVEVDPFACTRVSMGLSPFDFSWLLEPGQSLQTPEAVLVYSDAGLGGMSRTYHKLYRTRLCRGGYRDRERPVLINNWEATYFDFTEDKLLAIVEAGQALGIELFVLDDGWFGKRNDDRSSLGDWFVNRTKLPGGLGRLADKVKSGGMRFGLWFEPEMVSPDSDLYREHPDWCLHVPDRTRTLGRNQLVLDLSRRDVCDEIVRRVSAILSSAPITYVKWDMNRHMTEIGSALLPPERQKETAHRYMLGLYRVMEEITGAFPQVLFESCSGGGGRFDPGILYYMPQTWTSDNTDAVVRLKIQYGTSIVYPAGAMGAHVSDVPNHQMHRTVPLAMRIDAALSGDFGFEMDLTVLTEEERRLASSRTALYKEARTLVQHGDFYRLRSPFDGNEAAWMFVSADRTEALAMYFLVLAEPMEPLRTLKLRGLDPDRAYKIDETGAIYGGDELMYRGIPVPAESGDFRSIVWRIRGQA